MKIKISKKMLVNHIKYDWWKYLITILLVSLVSYYATYLKNRLKRYELFQVFLPVEKLDDKYIEGSYHLIDGTDIQEITYYYMLPSEDAFYNAIQTQGLGASDLMMLPESSVSGAFFPYLSYFDDALINRCKSVFSEVEFLTFEGEGKEITIGVKIHDKNNTEYNNKLKISKAFNFTLEQNYYFFIPTISENMGKYGKDSSRDTGLKFLDYFLENEI